ncbi:MAG: type II toxin-antitoxin system mRNA interferase toxin, RelE/StbE family [Symploca sp. SIO1B1]|nr:type II toxin-antitoxin system mRNA interferase toxin, RelE/StbE family [Symploca sp. SIO1B1]NER99577.1 type II toxin-antitoxin system mRNA interferase toxin, RelE/StbE family [Symploca sp. SIO1B1]
MRKLVLTSRFKRSLRKFVKNNEGLRLQIEETLRQMEVELFASNLSTHRLKGEFEGLRACSCGYDCRIIFSLEKDSITNEEVVVLLNIGSHDAVY